MMTIQALWTAAAENIPVVYVICNNGVYRVLKVNMNMYKELVLKGEAPRYGLLAAVRYGRHSQIYGSL